MKPRHASRAMDEIGLPCHAMPLHESMLCRNSAMRLRLRPSSNRALPALEKLGIVYESQEEGLSNKNGQFLKANLIHSPEGGCPHSQWKICLRMAHNLEYHSLTDPYDRVVARFWADFAHKKRILVTKGEAQEDAKKEFPETLVLMEGAFDQISFGTLYLGGHEFGYPDNVSAFSMRSKHSGTSNFR
eukprot:Gb_19736 [translate_table: standard]